MEWDKLGDVSSGRYTARTSAVRLERNVFAVAVAEIGSSGFANIVQ
jgi:hypothetical protein